MSEYPLVEKLQELKKKYTGLSRQLSEPEVMSDMKKYIQLNREYKELEPIVAAGDMYVKRSRILRVRRITFPRKRTRT